ncbi:MAG: hypothetical protein ABI425_03435 [Patescibacteria group bacterium]
MRHNHNLAGSAVGKTLTQWREMLEELGITMQQVQQKNNYILLTVTLPDSVTLQCGGFEQFPLEDIADWYQQDIYLQEEKVLFTEWIIRKGESIIDRRVTFPRP